MKFHLLILALIFSAFHVPRSAFAQGPLTPPGAPAPTMKTLDQVEPRKEINAVNAPGDADSIFKITQPGSYYLTGNITGVSGKIGIEIAVAADGPGVTIDLMGFELAGAPGSLDGIAATGTGTRNIAIRNGTVRAWGGDGIDIFNSQNNLLSDLRAQGNGARGIHAGASTTITGCTAQSNTGDGISALTGSTVTACASAFNGGDGIAADIGSTVKGCTMLNNGGDGIFAAASSVTNCTVRGSTGDGILASGCTVTDCTVQSSAGDGFDASNGSTVTGCTASSNTGDGFNVSNGSTITGCTARSNTGDGIDLGSHCTVTRCTSSSNTLNGIRIGSNSRVTDNTCDDNGVGVGLFSGIFTLGDHNRIEGNNVTNNDFGIGVGGVGHLIVRNYAGSNTNNYSLPGSGSFIGTIVATEAGMNAAENALINISF